MAEEPKVAEAPVKKKKNLLPIVLAIALALGGGGFFMMKKNSGAKKPAEPAIKISTKAPLPLKEFLVNLKDNGVYLRTEIALQVKDGFEPKKMEEQGPAVQDAIIAVLTSKSLDQVRTPEGKNALKKEIAIAVNEVLKEEGPADDSTAKDDKKSKDTKDSGKKSKDKEKADEVPDDIPDGWDSAKGPVLKVYFTSFATQ